MLTKTILLAGTVGGALYFFLDNLGRACGVW